MILHTTHATGDLPATLLHDPSAPSSPATTAATITPEQREAARAEIEYGLRSVAFPDWNTRVFAVDDRTDAVLAALGLTVSDEGAEK